MSIRAHVYSVIYVFFVCLFVVVFCTNLGEFPNTSALAAGDAQKLKKEVTTLQEKVVRIVLIITCCYSLVIYSVHKVIVESSLKQKNLWPKTRSTK